MGLKRNRLVEWLAFVIALSVLSCPQPMNEAFTDKITQDIQEAVAPARVLTVAGDGNGVVTPSGGVEVKDGIAFKITATAFSSHVFKRWIKQSGTGTVSFASSSLADTTVTVAGGNAEIRAEFEARPTVFYTTPTGTGIYTNTKIFIYFSKAMDEASIESAGAITVSKGGTVPVEGTVDLISPTVARFTPAAYLSPQQYHVVRIAKSVTDANAASMEADYSGSFRTASTADTEAPTAVSFTINAGTPSYVGTPSITLTEVAAVDGGEVVEALIQENGGTLQSFSFSPTIPYVLSASEGPKTIRIYAVDSVGNVSTAYAERTVALDTAAPVISSFAVASTGDGAYTNTTSITLNNAVSDSAGTPMEMRFSNDGSSWTAWAPYAATSAHTLGAGDGAKTVYCQFQDASGLAGHTVSGSYAVTLDTVDPSVTLDSPTNSLTVAGTVNCAATATDAGAGIWKVEFFGNTVSLGAVTASPYAKSWAVHSLTEDNSFGAYAVAYDRAGNTTTTATNSVTIDNYTETLVTPGTVGTFTGGGSTAIAYGTDYNNIVIVYVTSSTTLASIYSTGGTATWSTAKTIGTGTRPTLVKSDDRRLHLFAINGVSIQQWISNDGGGSWVGPNTISSFDVNSSYGIPNVAVSGPNMHLYYINSSNTISHHYSSNYGNSWSQTSPVSSIPSPTWISATGTPNGIHVAARGNSGLLYHGVYSVIGGYTQIASRPVAPINTMGGISIAARDDAPNILSIAFAGTGNALNSLSSTNGGSMWTQNTISASYLAPYPATTVGFNNKSGEPTYYVAANNNSATKLSIAKSSDGMTWYTFGIATTAAGTMPSSISDGEFAYIAYYDSSAQRLKFAKVKVNF